MSQPRTWTLYGQAEGNTPLFSGVIDEDEVIQVIELEPVLDLLERSYQMQRGLGPTALTDELRSLLHSHGRLQESQ